MKIVYDNTIRHHGVRGQKWGDRNGPPYPLDGKDHSPSEKKAGWRKSLDKKPNEFYDKSTDNDSKKKKGLTKNQKRAIAIGATVTAVALASIGAYALYKTGKLDFLSKRGKTVLDDIGSGSGFSLLGKKREDIDKKMVKKINNGLIGMHSSPERMTNCAHCSVSYILNSGFGKNTSAKGCSGIDEVSGLVAPGRDHKIFYSIFDGIKTHSYANNGRSLPSVSKAMKDIPSGTTGICFLNDGCGSGHFVNYEKAKNGLVTIVDAQSGFVTDSKIWDKNYSVIEILDLSHALLRSDADSILKNMVVGN